MFSQLGEVTSKESRSWSIDAFNFIELLPNAVCLLDEEGLICHANSEFNSSIGPIARRKDKDFLKTVIHKDDRDEFHAALENAIDKYSSSHFSINYNKCKTIRYNSRGKCEELIFYDWTISSGFGMIVISGK